MSTISFGDEEDRLSAVIWMLDSPPALAFAFAIGECSGDPPGLPPNFFVGIAARSPFFFTLLCQLIKAFEVCSSKIDFFMCDPICVTSAYNGSVM